jgi:hypothetical protein
MLNKLKKLTLVFLLILFSSFSFSISHAIVIDDGTKGCTNLSLYTNSTFSATCFKQCDTNGTTYNDAVCSYIREACGDSSAPIYNTTECIKVLLGVSEIDTSGLLVKRNPTEFIATIIKVLLAIVMVIVIFRIVLAGISIANAKEDGDKRKEGFQKVVNAMLGLIISLSAFGLTQVVQNALTSNVSDGDLLLDCKSLDPKVYSAAVIQRCYDLQNTPTPKPAYCSTLPPAQLPQYPECN